MKPIALAEKRYCCFFAENFVRNFNSVKCYGKTKMTIFVLSLWGVCGGVMIWVDDKETVEPFSFVFI